MTHRYEIVPVTTYELRRTVVSENGEILLRAGKPLADRVGTFATEERAAHFRDQLIEMDTACVSTAVGRLRHE